jgi:hypothetical protein
LTILHGSPQRTMVSIFDPSGEAGAAIASAFPVVVAGEFVDTPEGIHAAVDVIAVEWAQTAGLARVYVSEGAGGGALIPPSRPDTMFMSAPIWHAFADMTDDCNPGDARFCLHGARFVALPWGAGADRLVGVDRNGAAIVIDPTPGNLRTHDAANETQPNTTTEAPGLAAASTDPSITRLRVANVNADPAPDLLAAYAGPLGGDTRLCLDRELSSCTSASTLDGLAGATCRDVAVARVVKHTRTPSTLTPGATPIVLLCGDINRRDVYRVVHDAGGFKADLLIANVGASIDKLEVGDVNGDAVDDLLLLDRAAGFPQLRVYLQCTTREACAK